MKKAYHISSGKLIDAENAQYNEYYGVFQCPSCQSIVTLRKGYKTSNGKIISPSFVHPKDADQNCPLRQNWGDLTSFNDNYSFESRGQNIRYLNKYLIQAVKSFIRSHDKHIKIKVFNTEEFLIKHGTKEDFFTYIDNNKDQYPDIENKELLYLNYSDKINYESQQTSIKNNSQIRHFDDKYKRNFKTIEYSFFKIYLYPQSQDLLLKIAQLIINKLKEKDRFLRFDSLLELRGFLAQNINLINSSQSLRLSLTLSPLSLVELSNGIGFKYNIGNDLIIDEQKQDEVLRIIKEKHYQVFRDIATLLPHLKPEVILQTLKLITLTKGFQVFINKYAIFINNNNYIFDFEKEKAEYFFDKLYNNKLTKEQKLFINELTYVFLKNLAYIDWVELLYQWTESHKQS